MSAKLDDIKLIELVKQNSHLYDKNHEEYNERAKKNITWKAIGVALGTTGEACQKRYRNLRDRFTKEKKVRGEAMLTDKSLPVVFKRMMFIWDHLLHRSSSSKSSHQEVLDNDNPDMNDETEIEVKIFGDIQQTVDGNTELDKKTVILCNDSVNNVYEGQDNVMYMYMETDGSNITNSADEAESSVNEQQTETRCAAGYKTIKISDICSSTESAFQKFSVGEQKLNHFNIIQESPKIINTSRQRYRTILPRIEKTKCTERENSCNQPNKTTKLTGGLLEASNSQLTLPKIEPWPCNDSFCAMIKLYLDEMKNPERLSAARLQILTILHNELYSKYK